MKTEDYKKGLEKARNKDIIVSLFLMFTKPLLFYYAWNTAMTKVFFLPEIDYWESFLLILLSNYIFKPNKKVRIYTNRFKLKNTK